LATDYGFWSKKSRPVRLQPEHRDAAGPQHPHLGLELHCAFTQFGGTEFAGSGRDPPHQVRDAYAEPRQRVVLGRQETDSVNPPARSNFQNRFPGRAKCRPSSPESVPGLIPQKSTRRSGPTRSARACSMARTYASAEVLRVTGVLPGQGGWRCPSPNAEHSVGLVQSSAARLAQSSRKASRSGRYAWRTTKMEEELSIAHIVPDALSQTRRSGPSVQPGFQVGSVLGEHDRTLPLAGYGSSAAGPSPG